MISALAAVGVGLSTAIGQYATVIRKKRRLCLLMLLGFTRGQIALLPLSWAALSSIAGVLVAGLVYLAIDPAIEQAFAGQLLTGLAASRPPKRSRTWRWSTTWRPAAAP